MAVPPVDQEPTEQVNSLSHLDLSSSHADKNSLDIKTAEKQATVTAETKVEYIQDLLAAAKHTYTVRNTNSLKLHQLARKYLPGGNTRSVLFTDPFPLCMEQGYGNRLIDSDGHEFVPVVHLPERARCADFYAHE